MRAEHARHFPFATNTKQLELTLTPSTFAYNVDNANAAQQSTPPSAPLTQQHYKMSREEDRGGKK